ncbi:hypothetical protein BDR05DRAFT_1004762 [Suillus weaverae]|nr:hypothetical protein BDR05DRAFT_1004762 [Suillus weaverae]
MTLPQRMQTSAKGTYTGMLHCAGGILKNEGPLAFYKGTLTPLLGIGVCVSIQFGVLGYSKWIFTAQNLARGEGGVKGKMLGGGQLVIAGVAVGLANGIVSGPVEHIRNQPFLPHPSDSEYYICITSARHADTLLFTTSGGVDAGDVDAKALKLDIPVLAHKKEVLTDFLVRLYSVYVDLHFAYLEINPLVVLDDGSIHYLDMAAKLDRTAESIFGPKWAVARDLTVYETAPAATTTILLF